MSILSKDTTGVPDFEGERMEFVRNDFDRTHSGDMIDDLMRSARVDKHDKGMFLEWLALATDREMQSSVVNQLDSLL